MVMVELVWKTFLSYYLIGQDSDTKITANAVFLCITGKEKNIVSYNK